ncbi:MAG: thioesterase [Pseudobdellovibrio sp.]
MDLKDLVLDLRPFKPIIPVWTGHSQTVLGHLIPSDKILKTFEKHTLTLADGDQLLLKYKNNNSKFTLSVYHGLGGNADSDYMRRSANLGLQLGWNVVLVNHRLASNEVKASKSYHSGRGEDAEAVLDWCKEKFIDSKQVAIGFSMSGSILLNLLARRSGKRSPDYAIVVNAPLKLESASKLLTKNFSKIYDIRFYLMLKKIVQSQDSIKLPFIGSTMDIDDIYTSLKNGFKDRHDYYHQCSSWAYLNQINTPLFVLSSEDDPFVDIETYRTAHWPNQAHITISKFGGHMGYIDKLKSADFGRRWLDHYLMTVMKKITNL